MKREFIRQLERADVEGWASHQAAAPREFVDHFGFELERPRGATFMIATRRDVLGLNRALGIGAFEELTPAVLDESIEIYRSRGVAKAMLQIFS